MAWDTERTKRLLLDAATEEFSRYGLAGARVDRIAASAGVNKERIYQYFGKKDELFATVLGTRLRDLVEEVPMLGTGPDAVGDYAGRLFEHHLRDETIPRLVFWEGLELGADAVADARREYHAEKVARFQAMLPGLGREAAGELLLAIVTLVNAWPVIAQLDRQLVTGATDGADGAAVAADPAARIAVRRAYLERAATALAGAALAEAAGAALAAHAADSNG
ncbi:TetR/AcrR family transcriptional regulator [Agromyces aurantiacus]|uniref:TetR/AcrR family transcriptional regulator n=1 Tax=Agromyces aurantiacus TaxID=165814 RepID=A0ABV9R109_9MICO|nr:TetR/AcrR family transcriptional regulator [Agromyces aurantiacus]MBM7505832.1 AcrR family transcriptional regulator [Agromyces aurantiacus]